MILEPDMMDGLPGRFSDPSESRLITIRIAHRNVRDGSI